MTQISDLLCTTLVDNLYVGTYQAFYSSQLLAVVVLVCSKAALALLVLSLKPFSGIVLACKVILGLICGWAVAALFALGLQCELPSPWDSSQGRCVNQYAMYVMLGVAHMLLDLAVIALPIALLWQVQISQQKRLNISALFASRILYVKYHPSPWPFYRNYSLLTKLIAPFPESWLSQSQVFGRCNPISMRNPSINPGTLWCQPYGSNWYKAPRSSAHVYPL